MPKKFLAILFLGLVLRFLFIGNSGFLADVAFWKSWSLAASDHGIVWTSLNTNINYPPGFIYVLWLMGKIYTLLGDPHNFNDFWRQNNFGFLLASKSISILADIAIACLIYWFFSRFSPVIPSAARNLSTSLSSNKSRDPSTRQSSWLARDDKLGFLLSSVFFLNPVVILDSAVWGQVESFGMLFTLIAIILLFYKRPFLATAIFTIGTLMKLQNIIFIPIYFVFVFRYFDFRTMVKSAGTAVFTFFLVILPFVLEKQVNQVLYLLTVNSDYFPWLSLNAHNFWWIIAGGFGMQVIDKITVLGIVNAKTTGLLLFAVCYFLFVVLVYRKPTPRNFLLSLTLSIFSFFLFTTQSHERYSYPVIVLLLFLYPFLSFRNLNYFWLIYFLLTLSVFFNIHTGLVVNYPQNGFQILTALTTTKLTILNSYLLILLFFTMLPYVFSQISSLFFAVCCLLFVGAVTILNTPYILGTPISLTSFKPVLNRQDFGVLQTNKSTNSSSGWKSWSRLSNNYFYYRKGFGTHANSNIVFDVNRKFRSFSTDFGVDTEAATPASVIFRINGDGKLLYESPKMGRFDYPLHAKVDIAGVKNLGLEVIDGGDGINSDHADWLNPVLYK